MSALLNPELQLTIEAIGWTLVHFLWQGACLALALAVLLAWLPRSAVNARYLAGCCCLAIMAAFPAATYMTLAFEPPTASATFGSNKSAGTVNPVPIQQLWDELDRTGHANAAAALDGAASSPADGASWATWRIRMVRLLPWLVGGWALGVAIGSLRLSVGWFKLEGLRRRETRSVPESWTQTLDRLATRIGVGRPVRLLESALVEAPTLFGWLKPMILVPASALAGLEPRQFEALLLHELAHIRRHDYLVNLVQTVIETLLFYHPGVWWVSATIRSAREECCDEIAATTCGNRIEYARSLATMEELRGTCSTSPSRRRLAVAANGGNLTARIHRVVGISPSPANRSAWWMLAAGGIAMALLFAIVPRRAAQIEATEPVANRGDEEWGPERDGLRARLTLLTEKPTVGKPLLVRLELRNVSSRPKQYYPQAAMAFRIVEIKSADGRPVESIGPRYQTSGGKSTILPNETVTTWTDVDVAEMFLLIEPGDYTITTKPAASPFRDMPRKPDDVLSDLPGSNTLNLQVQPGTIPDSKAMLLKMRQLAPAPWRVDTNFGAIYFTHSPTGLKSDVSTIQLWFTPVPLPPEEKVRLAATKQIVDELGKARLGFANLAATPKVKEIWPEYVKQIQAQLFAKIPAPRAAPPVLIAPNVQRRDSAAKPSLKVRVVNERDAVVDSAYVNLWIKVDPQTESRDFRWTEGSTVWERFRNWSPEYRRKPFGEVVFDGLPDGEYRVTAAKQVGEIGKGWTPAGLGPVVKLAGKASATTPVRLEPGVPLTVRVVDAATNRPRPRASVRLYRDDGMPIVGAAFGTANFLDRVDQNGELHYHELRPGRYSVEVLSEPPTLAVAVEYAAVKPVPVEVTAGKMNRIEIPVRGRRLTELELDEHWPHSVYGRVTDGAGQPMEGVAVTAHTGMGTLRTGGETVSDKDGRYRLRFSKGIWGSVNLIQVATINARKAGYCEANLCRQGNFMMADEKPPEGAVKGYVGVILPHEPQHIDFVMLPATRVHGVILDDGGQPLEGMHVSLTGPELPPSSSVIAQTHTDMGGRFQLSDIPVGRQFQLLIEPARPGTPWKSWASPPFEFLDSGLKAIHARSSRTEILADRLELQIKGHGRSDALKLAQGTDGRLNYTGRDLQVTQVTGGAKVAGSILRLVLETASE